MSRRKLTITGEELLTRDGLVGGGGNTNKFCKRLSVAALPIPRVSLLAGSSSAIPADTLTLQARVFERLAKDDVRGFAGRKQQ